MHKSALIHAQCFVHTYLKQHPAKRPRVVDIGSLNLNGSIKDIFPKQVDYIGLDFEKGEGVDRVVTDPYSLPVDDETADIVVCSSVYEHSEMFWLLFLECLRLLKPQGLLYINSPSNGMVHRFPVDAWRFYPDSGEALVTWAERNGFLPLMLESFIGDQIPEAGLEGHWNDFVAIFLKDKQFEALYPSRISDAKQGLQGVIAHGRENVKKQFENNQDLDQLSNFSNQVAQLTEKVKDREGQVAQLTREISEIYSSRSWQLMKWYRVTGSLVFNSIIRTKKSFYLFSRVIASRLPLSGATKSKVRHFIFGDATILERHKADTPNDNKAMGIPPKWRVQKIKFDNTGNRYYDYKENQAAETVVKLIAHYLPQFHPFKENDEWWGKGFTEWTNVTKATPKFHQHYQPRLPTHLGFYDLRLPDVMKEQVRLAKNYGIYGFAYYFYWFGGKTLMEIPLRNMLKNKEIEMPFCLTWANENWTRKWDGAEHDILIAQNHSKDDSLNFLRHVMEYMQDDRYITVDGKPVLMIYRVDLIPGIKSITKMWRKEAIKNGFPGLYLVAVKSFGIHDVQKFGCDAATDFPPHKINITGESSLDLETSPEFTGLVYDYGAVVRQAMNTPEPREKTFGSVMLGWDNTARKGHAAHIFANFNLLQYKQWLSNQCHRVYHDNQLSSSEKFVFINAWNEWAEGAYLEPDRRFGYGYLDSTHSVIKNYALLSGTELSFRKFTRTSKSAIIIHLHYTELWKDIYGLIVNAEASDSDIYITATSLEAISIVKNDLPNAQTMLVENRGRDILPFLYTLKHISKMGYESVCKVHSKKSLYRKDGDQIRSQSYSALLGSKQKYIDMINKFSVNKTLGMAVPAHSLLEHDKNTMIYSSSNVDLVSKKIDVPFIRDVFPAGSMFWFRPDALAPLQKLASEDFELELGLSDGTVAHAVERVFATVIQYTGYTVNVIPKDGAL